MRVKNGGVSEFLVTLRLLCQSGQYKGVLTVPNSGLNYTQQRYSLLNVLSALQQKPEAILKKPEKQQHTFRSLALATIESWADHGL